MESRDPVPITQGFDSVGRATKQTKRTGSYGTKASKGRTDVAEVHDEQVRLLEPAVSGPRLLSCHQRECICVAHVHTSCVAFPILSISCTPHTKHSLRLCDGKQDVGIFPCASI